MEEDQTAAPKTEEVTTEVEEVPAETVPVELKSEVPIDETPTIIGPTTPVEESSPQIPPTATSTATVTAPVTSPIQTIFETNRQKIRQFLERAQAAIQTRKQKRLERIMAMFNKKNKITAKEAERLLHVGHTAANDYLNILERQGKIRQLHKRGPLTEYEKI